MIKILLTTSLLLISTNLVFATNYCLDASVIVCSPMHTNESPISDASGHGHTGALDSAGNPAYTSTTPTGYASGSYTFTSDKINFGDVSAYSPEIGSTGKLTIVAWANFNSIQIGSGQRMWVATKGAGSNYEYALATIGDGVHAQIKAFIWDNNGCDRMVATGSTNLAAGGNGYFMGMVYDRTAPSLTPYLNGSVENASSSLGGGCSDASDGTGRLLLGQRDDGGANVLDGTISEFAIFSRALSTAEMLDIKNNGLDGNKGNGAITTPPVLTIHGTLNQNGALKFQ